MSTSRVLQFQGFRARLERRVQRAALLYGADADRAQLIPHLFSAITAAAADRGALVWVDEYGPGQPRTHVVLDLASELPRRTFPLEPLKLAWATGVPGFYDLPARDAGSRFSTPWGCSSLCAVALGSDGLRAWFLIVDGQNPRAPLDEDATGRIMFAAGECSGVVMHRDLPARVGSVLTPEGGSERFAGWPVLKDIEGHEDDDSTNSRISCRFLVTRAVRKLVEDDLGTDQESLAYELSGVRRELRDLFPGDPERSSWDEVLDALYGDDLARLTKALMGLGGQVETQGHFSGARELYRSAYEVAMAMGNERLALDAARLAGRACRRQASWEPALAWYDVARSLALVAGERGKEAVVLDGVANVHRERGNLPRARETLQQALAAAVEASDTYALGNVYQNLMAVSGLSGDHEGAVRYGWKAVQTHEGEEQRLKALTGLAMAFLVAGDLTAAEDAYAVAATSVKHLEYRLYALSGYAQTAGLRGDSLEFLRRVQQLDDAGFEHGSPAFRAEAHVELGHVFRALGDPGEAERRYRSGLAVAEAHRLNQVAFHAEKALEVLGTNEPPEPERAASLAESPSVEVAEIRSQLSLMRETAGALS